MELEANGTATNANNTTMNQINNHTTDKTILDNSIEDQQNYSSNKTQGNAVLN